jgi:hypothetical protein
MGASCCLIEVEKWKAGDVALPEEQEREVAAAARRAVA